jgi:hypothetical protein
VAALAALTLAFFWRAALLRGFIVHSDICYQFEPYKSFLHESLRAGRLPLWSPYIFCGYPLGGEGQVAAFYPVSLLISWLLPSPAAVNWLIITHVMIAGVSMYALARLLGASPFAAWLSGFVFSFSGYLFAHSHHVSLVCAAAWLPVVVLFVERAWQKGVLPNGVFAALAWGASALCGHPQTTFHISLLVAFWVSWRLVQAKRSEGRWQLGRSAAILGLVFALGFGAAAVQLLLTAEVAAAAPHGARGALDYVTSFSLRWHHLLGLVSPNWQGSPAFQDYDGEAFFWEYVLYVGLAPLALALVGGGTRRGWVLAGLAMAALVLALAQGNPLYELLRFLPGFSDFRVPARYVFMFTFAVALLAGYGWQVLARWRWLANGRWLAVCAGVIALLTAVDLWRFDRTMAPLASREFYSNRSPLADLLTADREWGRVMVLPPVVFDAAWTPAGGWARNPNGWWEARAMLAADVPQSYGLRSVGGYAAFVDPEHAKFFGMAESRLFGEGDPTLYRLVGTRYIAVGAQVSLSGMPKATLGPFAIYRVPDPFPRAFVVSGIVQVENRGDARGRTAGLGRGKRLTTAAVVCGDLGSFRTSPGATAEFSVEDPRPERVVVRARADGNAFLVLNERWDRGWRAYCDGRPAPLFEVDAVLMGTLLPEGEHVIEFVYRPRALIVGRAISLASVAVALLLLAAGPLVRRKRRAPSG